MESKNGCYVLMLVYVDENWMDIGGNIYPPEGFVKAKDFTKDIDIQNGLYGILWGKTCYFPYEKIDVGNWLVVKTELSEDLIKTDWYYNRYKFCNGWVVHAGNTRSSAKYIVSHKYDEDFIEEAGWIQEEEIAGSKEWLKEHSIGVS